MFHTSSTPIFQETKLPGLNPPTLIMLLLPLLPLIFFLISKRFSNSPPLPPGPFAWPIVGNIFQIGSNHVTLARLAQTYGPLLSLKLGPQLLVVGSSPTAAKEILRTHDHSLSNRFIIHAVPSASMKLEDFSLAWVSKVTSDWKSLRNLCRTELFSGKSINSQAWIRDQKVKEMLGFAHQMQGKVVKVRQLAFAAVINMVSNILFSKDVAPVEHESVNGKFCELVTGMMDLASAPNISDICPLLGPLDLQSLQKRANELCKEACKMWQASMEEKKLRKTDHDMDINGHSRSPDFLDTLIQHGFSNDQINVLFVELFFAATDTTSSTIEFFMAELTRNPRCMKTLQQELDEQIGKNSAVKEYDLPKLKYLDACFKETLRLHPTAPLLLPHQAAESCRVMGYAIPKGARVVVNAWAIGRDPSVWDEPLVFRPERFVAKPGLDFKGNDFELAPFGSGKRMCFGMSMAVRQIPLIVANLVHAFDWCLPEGNNITVSNIDMTEKYGLAMRLNHPLHLVPKPKTA